MRTRDRLGRRNDFERRSWRLLSGPPSGVQRMPSPEEGNSLLLPALRTEQYGETPTGKARCKDGPQRG